MWTLQRQRQITHEQRNPCSTTCFFVLLEPSRVDSAREGQGFKVGTWSAWKGSVRRLSCSGVKNYQRLGVELSFWRKQWRGNRGFGSGEKGSTSGYFCFVLPLPYLLENPSQVELHAHLNGCVRPSTLRELSGGVVPLRPPSKNLSECFLVFKDIHQVVDSSTALRRVTREVR